MKTQKITLPKSVTRNWHEIDVSSNSMGRVATQIANLLRGKHKRDFTPHMDMGDFVVATNVDKIKLTGRKVEQKKYYSHSGYLGGLKTKELKNIIADKPEEVLKRAVFSMLDEVKFRKTMMGRLKIVTGSTHAFNVGKK